MTGLIYMVYPEKIYVMMDTLCTCGDSKKPFNYASKIYLLPHLKTIMCGTGQVDIIRYWYNFIQNNIMAKNFNYLIKKAPSVLLDIWKNYKNKEDLSVTIYHFGYDKSNKKFVGYAFRSTNDFKAQKIENGFGFKPELPKKEELSDIDIGEQTNYIDVLKEIFKRMKERDDKKEISEKVGIGGEIQLAIYDKPNSIHFLTIYKFSDFEEKFTEMLNEGQKQNLEQAVKDFMKEFK